MGGVKKKKPAFISPQKQGFLSFFVAAFTLTNRLVRKSPEKHLLYLCKCLNFNNYWSG